MNAFSFEVRRTTLAKLLLGISLILYVTRIVMGVADYHVLGGVSVQGIKELLVMSLLISAVLLLWDIRDKIVRD